jgi:hypothetical protein
MSSPPTQTNSKDLYIHFYIQVSRFHNACNHVHAGNTCSSLARSMGMAESIVPTGVAVGYFKYHVGLVLRAA